MPRVVLSVISDLNTDQRIHKISQTLHEQGFEVLVIGHEKKDSLPLQPKAYKRKRLHTFFKKGKFFYIEFNFRLTLSLLKCKTDIYTANDLDTLLANFIAARLLGKRLIYDSHEYFTEVAELKHRPLTRTIWKILERLLLPRVKFAQTVNDTIAKIYYQQYRIEMLSIRNLPYRIEVIEQPRAKPPVILLQGNMNIGRGIELAIDAMEYVSDAVLWLIGAGDLYLQMQQKVKQQHLENKIKFWGSVPFEGLSRLTAQASIGLAIEEDLGLNYRLGIPNKIYDYIQNRVPLIVSDLSERAALTQQYKIGLILKQREPIALAYCIQYMLSSPSLYQEFVQNIEKAAQELTWEKEAPKLIALYQNAIKSKK